MVDGPVVQCVQCGHRLAVLPEPLQHGIAAELLHLRGLIVGEGEFLRLGRPRHGRHHETLGAGAQGGSQEEDEEKPDFHGK